MKTISTFQFNRSVKHNAVKALLPFVPVRTAFKMIRANAEHLFEGKSICDAYDKDLVIHPFKH